MGDVDGYFGGVLYYYFDIVRLCLYMIGFDFDLYRIVGMYMMMVNG